MPSSFECITLLAEMILVRTSEIPPVCGISSRPWRMRMFCLYDVGTEKWRGGKRYYDPTLVPFCHESAEIVPHSENPFLDSERAVSDVFALAHCIPSLLS